MKAISFFAGMMIFSLAFSQTKKTEWSLAKSKNNVDLSYRWIYLAGEEKIREMKAEFTVNADVNSILNQFTNSSNLKKWQNSAEECKVTKHSENQWNTYMSFSLPWPLKSKDLVVENNLRKSAGYILLQMSSKPESEPVYEGKNRINSLESEWKFIPQKSGETKVIYTTLTYDKPEFPRTITDPIIQKKLFQSIDLLKQYASK